jgi:RHS repeat-associated protein
LHYCFTDTRDTIESLAEEAVLSGADETVQWTLTDHLNTVRDIAKYDSGSDMTTVVNHLIYDAFGRVTSESNSTIDSLFLFTGRPFDSDTQLQNNLNRWYDARVGRWLSEDPIGFAAGDGNLYRYVGNSPVSRRDPIGENGQGYNPNLGKPFEPPGRKPGFYLCWRKIQNSGDCCIDFFIGIINAIFSAHCYIQAGAVDEAGHPLPGTQGWGIAGGGPGTLPSKEMAFRPDGCKKLVKSNGILSYGPAAGKVALSVSDDDIRACIAETPMRKPYSSIGYNCCAWAYDAVHACGLQIEA